MNLFQRKIVKLNDIFVLDFRYCSRPEIIIIIWLRKFITLLLGV